MGVKHLTLAVVLVASVVTVTAQVVAVELGELEAVSGNHPPYVFRLAIVSLPRGPSDLPAITVRSPQDALSVVKNHSLELRLRSLTDVELEVSHGGQTLNRLLLKGELQAARARMEASSAWHRYQAAKAKGSTPPQLAGLLDTAYEAHQTWMQFDPAAAQQLFAQVEQERLRIIAAGSGRPERTPEGAMMRANPVVEGKPPAAAPTGDPAPPLLERELQIIREEIHSLMRSVTPWEGIAMPTGHAEARTPSPMFTLLLGGLLIAGITSLMTGYIVQRRALGRERQRQRMLAASIRRARAALTSGGATLAAVQRAQLLGDQPDTLKSLTVVRRVRVSHKMRRRLHVQASSDTGEGTQERTAERTRVVTGLSRTRPSAPAELVEALRNLRRELLNRQRALPTSVLLKSPDSGSEQTRR